MQWDCNTLFTMAVSLLLGAMAGYGHGCHVGYWEGVRTLLKIQAKDSDD